MWARLSHLSASPTLELLEPNSGGDGPAQKMLGRGDVAPVCTIAMHMHTYMHKPGPCPNPRLTLPPTLTLNLASCSPSSLTESRPPSSAPPRSWATRPRRRSRPRCRQPPASRYTRCAPARSENRLPLFAAFRLSSSHALAQGCPLYPRGKRSSRETAERPDAAPMPAVRRQLCLPYLTIQARRAPPSQGCGPGAA